MSTWLEAPTDLAPDSLGAFAARHPLAARLLSQRGFRDPDHVSSFLNPDSYRASSPFDLPGMEEGIERIAAAIGSGERIGVWGDFDVDGLTGTAILVGALRSAGADVLYHIPVRATASHGVHRPVLEDLVRRGVRLLITCDTGIDAYEETAYAQSHGVDMIISDHHRLPQRLSRRLPAAQAIINPHLAPAGHPFNSLPGAGVAYEIVEGLAQHGVAGIQPENFLDLTALAVVADVVPVLGEARWLLQRGLRSIHASIRPPLQAMCERVEIDPLNLTEEHIGYLLAPRINAVGRLDDAADLVEFFNSEDGGFIEKTVTRMEALNARRRLLSQEVFESALGMLTREPSLLEAPVIVLTHPTWQAGVIGIVAGRLAQTYGRPVILIANDEKTGLGRGSARSTAGVDIAAAIARQSHLLITHGGHAAAAGLSLPSENIDDFRRSLAHTIIEMTAGREQRASLLIDGFLTLSEITLDLAEEVELLAPFGPGNPGPVFACRNLRLASASPIGRSQEHLKGRVEDERGNFQDVFWWQGVGQPMPYEVFDLAFSLRAVTDRGKRGLQLVWIEARPSETAQIAIGDTSRLPYEIIDMRTHADPRPLLENLLLEQAGQVQIWCEGGACPPDVAPEICRRRDDLQNGEVLVIWNAPPARDVFQTAVAAVKPRRIYLFSAMPASPSASEFLRQLAGYIKNALRSKEGRLDVPTLAALTAQTEAATRLGVEWLVARGDIAYASSERRTGNEIVVGVPQERKIDQSGAAHLLEQIKAALAESAAFREFYQRVEPGALF